MKKFFFMAATAALALSSCSSDELVQEQTTPADDNVINFGVYEARQTRTAGGAQNINIEDLQASGKGFGVFAYEQGSQDLAAYLASSTVPNFMYNDHVTYSDPDWNSEVVKYWPNNGDKVSFLAYAPYDKDIKPLFNVAYNGIGIRYNAADNKDLLWGCEKSQTSAPLNKQKPGIAETIDFTFKHALNKVDINVSYNADELCNSSTNNLAEKTKITIRSVKLVGNIPTQGVLNLSNGNWEVEKTNGEWAFTTTDFRCTNAVGGNAVESPNVAGVFTKSSSHTLYTEKSLMVIPTTNEVYLEVTYDVESGDLGTPNYSCVTNTVKSTEIPAVGYPDTHNALTDGKISLGAGKWTTINVHLGMTSVKFTAEVANWDDTTAKDIDMPANFPSGFALVNMITCPQEQPATGAVGDLYYDTVNGKVMKCTVAGTPGEWEVGTVDGVIKVGSAYFEIAAGVKSGEALTVTPIYYDATNKNYKDNKELTGSAVSLTIGSYYLINGTTLYKKV